jgi:hypothetical protein
MWPLGYGSSTRRHPAAWLMSQMSDRLPGLGVMNERFIVPPAIDLS